MQFDYIARTKLSEMQNGVVEAINEKAAIAALQAKGLIILELKAFSGSAFSLNLKLFQRVKSKEVSIFARQLATLVSAQVPLLTSLQSLSKQVENEYFKEILFEVSNDIEGGTLFSKALARHPKIFSEFFVNMIKAGEASGGMEKSLLYLADYLEKQDHLNSRVRGALIYPGVILGAFAAIAVLMMIFVVPKLTSFLQEAGQELPFMTRAMIGTSNFLISWWWLLLILISGGTYYAFYAVKNKPSARRQWDLLKLKMPVFGKRVFEKIYITRFAENLSTLIQGGLSILQALQVTSEVLGNVIYRDIVIEAKESVRIGESLSSSLAKHKEMPPLVTQMIATGEQTGSLDVILKKMGQFYSREADTTIDTISQLIEPFLILLIGGGVIVLIMAILMPIYNVAGGL
ncbi:MAG: type II secretion system F family protein [Candidatus Portnoybacteria bacterium]|nr:type II secretion system F family protein [Candidatus Portnoybacteria bacterium]MDD4982889.1 type II secretion system F family protein [Candidatus Portnoybacteria bacterium]